jgi:hypothetical protein
MNPIIFRWTRPRAMSTLIECITPERGDFDCLPAPFLRCYYLQGIGKSLPLFDSSPDDPCSYESSSGWIRAPSANESQLAGYLDHRPPFYRHQREHSLTGIADEQ